jgi:TolB-like protein
LIYNFEEYSLDLDRQELRRGAELVAVEPQVLDLLHFLIRNRARVVSKDDLIADVWKGRIVSDSTLTSRITSARQAIGDSGEQQRLIRTIARKGLRFVGEVHESAAKQAPPVKGDVALPAAPGADARSFPDKPPIAVLPFTNMSGDPEQDYFSDGITEDIITALSRFRWFLVIARSSTFVYKGQGADVKQVGRDLGARYVLEGSVRKRGQRVRITAQLIDAASGGHIWAEQYDRDLTDIFAVQDEITARVAAAIQPKLWEAENLRGSKRSADDLDAWDLVARAMSHQYKLTLADSETAIGILRQAAQRYPDYAPAHALLAYIPILSAAVGWTPLARVREFAVAHINRALALDPEETWVHEALGGLADCCGQNDDAVRHFHTALDLNPNLATARCNLGWVLLRGDRLEEALAAFELTRKLRTSPHDPWCAFELAGIGAVHYFAGRYLEAAKWARQSAQVRGGLLAGYRFLCASLAQAGQIDEARSAMRTLRQLHPEITIAWIKQSLPMYAPRLMAHYLEGLRKAGLPEGRAVEAASFVTPRPQEVSHLR